MYHYSTDPSRLVAHDRFRPTLQLPGIAVAVPVARKIAGTYTIIIIIYLSLVFHRLRDPSVVRSTWIPEVVGSLSAM